jgi:hypothetical protein
VPCRRKTAPAPDAAAGLPWFIDAVYVGLFAAGLFLFGWLLLTKILALGLMHFGRATDARVVALWTEPGPGGRTDYWAGYEYTVHDVGPQTFSGKLQLMTETYEALRVGGTLPIRYFDSAPDVSGKPDEQKSPLWLDVLLLLVVIAMFCWAPTLITGSRVRVPGIFRRVLPRSTPAPPR